MPYLTVKVLKHGTFEVDVAGHNFVVEDGTAPTGRGAGPSPVDMTVVGLVCNVAAAVDDWLIRDSHLDTALRVTAHYRLSSTQPRQVASVDLTVNLPELAAERTAEVKGVIQRCVAGATIPPSLEVGLTLVTGEPASTGPALGADR
ncbi:MAG TPA: hypothetical protein VMW11_05070 [Candidatus Dormibacteraeota bacterium]|nr:hypothetical protein [Candidatus Dormibacteraeota bacterium]